MEQVFSLKNSKHWKTLYFLNCPYYFWTTSAELGWNPRVNRSSSSGRRWTLSKLRIPNEWCLSFLKFWLKLSLHKQNRSKHVPLLKKHLSTKQQISRQKLSWNIKTFNSKSSSLGFQTLKMIFLQVPCSKRLSSTVIPLAESLANVKLSNLDSKISNYRCFPSLTTPLDRSSRLRCPSGF